MTGSSRVPVRAAGVPGTLRTPPGDGPAPLVLCWHGFGAPASGAALADAFPLSGLPAWRAYFDLPLFGARLPEGGPLELARRQADDYVGELLGPVTERAVGELPGLLAALEERLGSLWDGRVALAGFSAGGQAVLRALTEKAARAEAAVIVGTPKDARTPAGVLARSSGVDVPWSLETEEIATGLDFVAGAPEVAASCSPPPALLVLHGERDDLTPVSDARALHGALSRAYADRGHEERVALEILAGPGHGVGGSGDGGRGATTGSGEVSGAVESVATAWLRRWLRTAGPAA